MLNENAKTGHRHLAIEATRSSITGGNADKDSPVVRMIPTTTIDVILPVKDLGGMNGNLSRGM